MTEIIKAKIYDLPTRFFHWAFSITFITAFAIGKWVDDESLLYSYHMLLGLWIGALTLLRITWGIIGSHHSQFKNFDLHPKSVVSYFLGLLTFKKWTKPGHNPASSWAAILMMAAALGLSLTGALMTGWNQKEQLEDLHEVLAHAFALTALAHVCGLIFHQFKFKDALPLSMVTGSKKFALPPDPIDTPPFSKLTLIYGFIGIFILITTAQTLWSHFDPGTKQLKIQSKNFQLGSQSEE